MAIKLYKKLLLANSMYYGHNYINCMNSYDGQNYNNGMNSYDGQSYNNDIESINGQSYNNDIESDGEYTYLEGNIVNRNMVNFYGLYETACVFGKNSYSNEEDSFYKEKVYFYDNRNNNGNNVNFGNIINQDINGNANIIGNNKKTKVKRGYIRIVNDLKDIKYDKSNERQLRNRKNK